MASDSASNQNEQATSIPFLAIGAARFAAYVVGQVLYVDDVQNADLASEALDALRAKAREFGCSTLVVRGKSVLVSEEAKALMRESGGCPIGLSEADCIFAFDASSQGALADQLDAGDAARALSLAHPLPPDITVYLVPHQDDELYTWGIDIANRTLEGENVAVILLTDGAACGARLLLGDGSSCHQLSDSHIYTLDKDACTHARDREFIESCMSLGLPEGNIHFALHRLRDLALAEQDGLREIERIVLAYPFARICAHAPRLEVSDEGSVDPSAPPHRDHRMLGKALDAMVRRGRVAWAEFCIEFYDIERFRQANPHAQVEVRRAADGAKPLLEAALAAYKTWDPDNGRYAIGWHTGPELHDLARANDANYVLAIQGGGQ